MAPRQTPTNLSDSKRLLLIAFLLVAALSLHCSRKDSSGGEPSSMYVVSRNGLQLREKAGRMYGAITTIPFGANVKILSTDGPVETIQGASAAWYQVEYEGKKGWVFSSSLADSADAVRRARLQAEAGIDPASTFFVLMDSSENYSGSPTSYDPTEGKEYPRFRGSHNFLLWALYGTLLKKGGPGVRKNIENLYDVGLGESRKDLYERLNRFAKDFYGEDLIVGRTNLPVPPSRGGYDPADGGPSYLASYNGPVLRKIYADLYVPPDHPIPVFHTTSGAIYNGAFREYMRGIVSDLTVYLADRGHLAIRAKAYRDAAVSDPNFDAASFAEADVHHSYPALPEGEDEWSFYWPRKKLLSFLYRRSLDGTLDILLSMLQDFLTHYDSTAANQLAPLVQGH